MERIRYFKVKLEDIVEKLKEYFNSKRNVTIAILFGSTLRRNIVRDIDIAVHINGEADLNKIINMSIELEELLKIPVDIIPLKQIPPPIRIRILLKGKPIIIKNKATYTEILKTTISEIQDLKLASKTLKQKQQS